MVILLALQSKIFSQSNINTYTPSKLMTKGQWDIKWTQNLYTQTRREDHGQILSEPRANFFGSFLNIFMGTSTSRRWNAGILLDYRSNTFGGQPILSVFKFVNVPMKNRHGPGSIAASIKFIPLARWPKFTWQTSFFFPLLRYEIKEGAYLDQNSYTWQNHFFYDHIFPNQKWQIYAELSSEYNVGQKKKTIDNYYTVSGGYANNSMSLAPGVYISYFPLERFTLLVYSQHFQLFDLGNDFAQNYTAIGAGTKLQISQKVNIEMLYGNFVRGTGSGLGQSFTLGMRSVF